LTTTTAIVPVRSFDGLTRLADVLAPARRSTLMVRMVSRTTEALRRAGVDIVVVTGDPTVRQWASQQGLRVVNEPDPPGLDAAATAGVDTLRGPWLVVHADLPMIIPDDVRAALECLAANDHLLAPSHDGGTNLIGSSWPTFPFAYGVGSFRRHLAAVPAARVLVRRGLALDLDRIRDLNVLRNLRSA
jgi:2-phospho-L-lactate guanylyltransferase